MDRLTALLNAPLAIRRLVAILILAVLCSAVAAGAWLTAGSLAGEARVIADKREQLGSLKAIVALRQALQNPAAAPGNNDTSALEFLSGSSEAVIRGNLQSRFTAIAAAHGVSVLSVGNTPISERNNVRYAGLRADFSGTNEAVHATLFEIETSTPYLVIREAKINSTLSSQSNKAKGDPEIVVQIEFFGALPPGQPGSGETTGATP